MSSSESERVEVLARRVERLEEALMFAERAIETLSAQYEAINQRLDDTIKHARNMEDRMRAQESRGGLGHEVEDDDAPNRDD
jgi:hypothetical protein